jgi:hypothetical protein
MSDLPPGLATYRTNPEPAAAPMFEVGRDYEIHTLEDTSDGTVESYTTYEVMDWQPPLLRVKQFNRENVFNTSSAYFVRAEKQLRPDEKKPSKYDALIAKLSPDDLNL